MPCCIKGFLDVQEHHSHRQFIVEIEGHVVCESHTLQCRAVMCMETKVACIKQAIFFNVLLEYFQNDFLTNLSVVDRRLNGRKF
jgi:hypothetical protein